MIAPGDTQALPRIPVPGAAVEGSLPTVALTIAPAASAAEVVPQPAAEAAPAPRRADAPAEPESHERIYEEAMATIAALASNWSSAVQQTTGRHRAAA